jgi:hypothetical protein
MARGIRLMCTLHSKAAAGHRVAVSNGVHWNNSSTCSAVKRQPVTVTHCEMVRQVQTDSWTILHDSCMIFCNPEQG